MVWLTDLTDLGVSVMKKFNELRMNRSMLVGHSIWYWRKC